MVNILFVSVPFSGHLNPVLEVARACHKQQQQDAHSGAASAGSVRLASWSKVRSKVEAAGVEFVGLGEPSSEEVAHIEGLASASVHSGGTGKPRSLAIFPCMERVMYPMLMRALEARGLAQEIDLVVTDCYTLAAYDAAETLGLPLVLLFPAALSLALTGVGFKHYNLPSNVPMEMMGPSWMLQPEKLTWAQWLTNPFYKRMASQMMEAQVGPLRNATRKELQLPEEQLPMFAPSRKVKDVLYIVGAAAELEVPNRPLPPNWLMSGAQGVHMPEDSYPVTSIARYEADRGVQGGEGAAIDRFLEEARGGAGDAEMQGSLWCTYLAGSVVKPTQQHVEALAEAMRAVEGARFVWSLPEACHSLLPKGWSEWGPEKVLVLAWAPQQALLCHPAVKLFVTHGGTNSTHEGVAAGKPLIVMPFFADQPVNAQHIVNKRLGAKLDPWTLEASTLAGQIRDLLADKETQELAAGLGRKLRAQVPGAQRAAEATFDFARRVCKGRKEAAKLNY